MENLIELRKKARSLSPIIHIGKNGITDALINEIEKTLKKKKMIKIKMNRSALDDKDKKEIAKELLIKTKSELVDFIGFNITIYKANSRNRYEDDFED